MESKTPANVEASASEYTRRVLFECNATRSELSNGKVVRIGEPSQVFTPARDASLSEEELAAAAVAFAYAAGVPNSVDAEASAHVVAVAG